MIKNKSDFLKLASLYVMTILVVYFTPKFLHYVYFLAIFVYFLKSTDTVFWLSYFLLLVDALGGLFSSYDPNYHLPSLPLLGGGAEIRFDEILIIILFVKTFNIHYEDFFSKQYKFFIAFCIYLFFLGLIFGINLNRIFLVFRLLIPFSLFYSFPRLIKNQGGLEKLVFYLLPFLVLNIGLQFFHLITFTKFAYLLGGSEMFGEKDFVDISTMLGPDTILRPIYGFIIAVSTFFISVYLLVIRKTNIPKIVLISGIILSTLVIFLSATRGWIISFSLMNILLMVFVYKNKLQYLAIVLIALIAIILAAQYYSPLQRHLVNTVDRFEPAIAYLNGEKGKYDYRIEYRLPKVMSKVFESPIVGFGYSEEFLINRDDHVANATILLNSGIVGVTFLIFMLGIIIHKVFIKLIKNNSASALTFLIFLIGILSIQFTSRFMISFIMDFFSP
ncbi:MAG TPA: hypothetical protein PK559_14205, partial [Ignavibacteriaceae bacterium]|nr:hypothetical protein [Ignavibacteriaceae bacterium]